MADLTDREKRDVLGMHKLAGQILEIIAVLDEALPAEERILAKLQRFERPIPSDIQVFRLRLERSRKILQLRPATEVIARMCEGGPLAINTKVM